MGLWLEVVFLKLCMEIQFCWAQQSQAFLKTTPQILHLFQMWWWSGLQAHHILSVLYFALRCDSSDVNLTKIFWSIFLFHFVNLYTFRNLLGKQKCFNFLPGSDDQENPSECAWIWYQVRAFSRMKGVCFWSQCNCTKDESVSLCTFPTFCLMWCSELKLETCKAPFSLIGMSAD